MKIPPSTSVIISTYNRPEALKLSINSLLAQSVVPNEIIVADDGSKEDTTKLVNDLSTKSSIPIIHCWQEDKGFRLAMVRNLALSKCKFEYVIQLDGDIICHKNFIEDHLSYANQNLIITGRRVHLSKEETLNSLAYGRLVFKNSNDNKLSFRFRNKFLMILFKLELINQYVNKGVLGSNMSYWLKDALDINGYNEKFVGWGKEDDEFVVRLMKKGIQKKTIRFGGIQYHLMHELQSIDNFEKNVEILDEIAGDRT